MAELRWIAAKTKHIACNVFQQSSKCYCYCCKQCMYVCKRRCFYCCCFFVLVFLQAIYDAKFRVHLCAYIKYCVIRQPWQSARRNCSSCNRVATTQRRWMVYTIVVCNNFYLYTYVYVHTYIFLFNQASKEATAYE